MCKVGKASASEVRRLHISPPVHLIQINNRRSLLFARGWQTCFFFHCTTYLGASLTHIPSNSLFPFISTYILIVQRIESHMLVCRNVRRLINLKISLCSCFFCSYAKFQNENTLFHTWSPRSVANTKIKGVQKHACVEDVRKHNYKLRKVCSLCIELWVWWKHEQGLVTLKQRRIIYKFFFQASTS